MWVAVSFNVVVKENNQQISYRFGGTTQMLPYQIPLETCIPNCIPVSLITLFRATTKKPSLTAMIWNLRIPPPIAKFVLITQLPNNQAFSSGINMKIGTHFIHEIAFIPTHPTEATTYFLSHHLISVFSNGTCCRLPVFISTIILMTRTSQCYSFFCFFVCLLIHQFIYLSFTEQVT